MLRSVHLGSSAPGATFSPEFNAEQYLSERSTTQQLHVVEFGHGLNPISLLRTYISQERRDIVSVREPGFWTGKRQYTGVENWMRGSTSIDGVCTQTKFESELEELDLDSANISFVSVPLQGHLVEDPEFDAGDASSDFRFYFEGQYSAETSLLEGVADEVVAGNIFNDPLLGCYDKLRRVALLAELARVRADDGVIVLRETITPRHFSLTEQDLATAGLGVLARVGRSVATDDLFKKLELTYSAHPNYLSPHGFYLFLGVAEPAQ